MRTIALDIGGTDIKYGIFENNSLQTGSFPVTDNNGNEDLPKQIHNFIINTPCNKLAICAPGPFDYKSGTSLMKHKLPSLYGISLKDIIKKAVKDIDVIFICDSAAFLLGAMEMHPYMKKGHHCCVMIGTGLGYMNCINGKLDVNENEIPRNSLWKRSYLDSICEEYVSAKAIKKGAQSLGYHNASVYKLSVCAREGNLHLLDLFKDTGRHLGHILNEQQKTDGFETIAIGGNVSRSFDLMEEGFLSVCNIPYTIASDPTNYPLYGLKYCSETGKENIYL